MYLYYQLDNFYQNHRRYVKSRSFTQLKGNWVDVDSLGDCDPIVKVSDLGDTVYNVNGKKLDGNLPANPCGLVAKSVFTDTFKLVHDSNEIPLNSTGIAWESDVKYKFKNLVSSGKNWKDYQWTNVEDGKLTFITLYRAFHCLDENRRTP